MVVGLRNGLFEFQQEAVSWLLDITSDPKRKNIITMKSPTGSGKTIILVNYIDEYLSRVNRSTAFIWLCPGKGNLEEQSREKMNTHVPNRATNNLFDALLGGFEAGSTTFINWELVTKSGNNALKDSEKKNLFDRISEAHRNGVEFMVIIDEEHSNNTSKARDIINAFSAKHIIRVSATTVSNGNVEFYEIDELDVIDAGLITKILYVNEGVEEGIEVESDYNYLLGLANKKRLQVKDKYQALGKDINPLVLIQFPNAQPEAVNLVVDKLKKMGYSHENGMVRKWFSEDKKDLPYDLTNNNNDVAFLLMKQAISTGWDCRRAKILVKLREGGTEAFQIQTIGRIRRMPEAKHYGIEELDYCYVYTFDEQYKAGLLSDLDKAYEVRRLFLKDKCRTFTLQKELRDLDYGGVDERQAFTKIYEYFVSTYHLTTADYLNKDMSDSNIVKLRSSEMGYVFGDQIITKALQGEFSKTESVQSNSEDLHITTRSKVSTHVHGIQLLHSIDSLKKVVHLESRTLKNILERLFRGDVNSKKKLLSLNLPEFYAFIINNEHRLKVDFRKISAQMHSQIPIPVTRKYETFKIPEKDFFKYDAGVRDEIEYLSNAYESYTSGCCSSSAGRSTSERLFENYCEDKKDEIEWVYKNGDSGQQYMSVVYFDGFNTQKLFYPDYIIKKKNDEVWIIETKGGELKGKSKNIDIQIANKFVEFKRYAEEHKINWGFVKDKDERLYINNTVYSENLSDTEHWVALEKEF
ncbi:DEAD/DEAH box helicase family protein [Clostridium sp.]|uniref:DEAD/DEAH box helicase n=1 Tax=Clostridium sp. TaxID=1506 RepID=UPI003216E87B